MTVMDASSVSPQLIGKPVLRLEDPALLRGRARFVDGKNIRMRMRGTQDGCVQGAGLDRQIIRRSAPGPLPDTCIRAPS
jgi:hypothetical protein